MSFISTKAKLKTNRLLAPGQPPGAQEKKTVQKRTIEKTQKQLDDFRFWNGKVSINWERQLVKNVEDEPYYLQHQRKDMQRLIDHIKEIEEQISQLKKEQNEYKKRFYEKFNGHYEMTQPL